jgi:uncharacterized short protein YbdD (DUF466 family)
MKRAQKAKLLTELLSGNPNTLLFVHQHRQQDPAKMKTTQLLAEHERLRRKQHQSTGVMPPPIPDFKAMSIEELRNYRDQKRSVKP